MTSDELFSLAEKKGHSVLYFDLQENKSVSVEDESRCFIGLDYSLRGMEEKEHLAHELGHCEYGGFYNRYSPYDVRGKSEQKASKWAFIHLTPIGEVKAAIKRGMGEPWELAEFFDVSVKFMVAALTYYKDAGSFDYACA